MQNESLASTTEANARVLTIDETAGVLRLSRAATYAAAKSGQIPCVRVGRRILVPRAALMKFLEAKLAAESV